MAHKITNGQESKFATTKSEYIDFMAHKITQI